MSTEIRYVEAFDTCAMYADHQSTESQIVTTVLGRPCQQAGVDLLLWDGTE